jgi:tetratricopeptide (TPR) repeat protein
MRRALLLAFGVLACPLALRAQAAPAPIQNATLRRAIRAYDNLDFALVVTVANQALRERLSSAERARAYELLGFAYSATNQPDQAITAFKEAILLEPDRELDPSKVSPRIGGYFNAALGQVMVVRLLQADSAQFIAGQGFVPIRYTVTSRARVRARAISGQTSVLLDSTITVGQVNLRWQARLPNGDPVPAGTYTIVVEAIAGQNSFSTSRQVRVTQGAVDTLPHLTALPGYTYLPEAEVPPKSWRPMGLALVYTGIALAGTSALSSGDLGSASLREGGTIGAGIVLAGFIMTLKKPAPQPARGNILYNQLLREQIARRNTEIAQENTRRRQQVALNVVPVAQPGGGR